VAFLGGGPQTQRAASNRPPLPKSKRHRGEAANPELMKPVIDAAERKRRKKSTLNRVINNVKAASIVHFKTATSQAMPHGGGSENSRCRWRAHPMVDGRPVQTTDQAAAPDFRPLVHAAMLTGARWGELRALKCRDYDPVSGTINIAESKSGKPRRVYLTDDGKAAFESWTAGRGESEVIFKDRFGNPWDRTTSTGPC